jgi:broad specificity phosphatase PhoE
MSEYAIMQREIYLVRHGLTEWSQNGRHTSFTDLPLLPEGIEECKLLKPYLEKISFSKIFTSPLKRARETCNLLGYSHSESVESDLTEWNYGILEGLTTPQIRRTIPDWTIFTHGSIQGESIADIQKRMNRLKEKICQNEGNILLFSSGHILRALTACWLDLPVEEGRKFLLSTGSLSILSYEKEDPVIKLWNFKPFF